MRFNLSSIATFLFIALAHFSFDANAQSQKREVAVATRVLPPMVVGKPGQLSGFSIELWDEIARRLDLRSTYEVAPDVGTLLKMVGSGKSELGVAAVSITSAREKEYEFSQPILNAGLQIMIRGSGRDPSVNPFRDLMGLLLSTTSLVWLAVALLLILLPAHIIWFFERRHSNGLVPPQYFPGIFYAMFWSASTLATQAEGHPRHWLARMLAVLWMFVGIVFVALYTAQLTAQLTVAQIHGNINGPEDLAGRKVSTTRGSTAAAVVRELNGQVVEVTAISEAFEALVNQSVDAVVFDSPVLLYYAANEGKGRVQLIGSPFRKEDYGIVFRPNNPLRREVNATLLAIREDGSYQRIYERWFGAGISAK